LPDTLGVKPNKESQVNAIARLLKPRSVAIVGASADPSKTTGRPVLYLQKQGFEGAIYPVNPRADAIAGLKCYPDVSSLPETPDAALVLLGPDRVNAAVRELAARGTAAAVVLAGGYSETGEAGARRQRELKDAIGGMRLLGPNTIGLVNLTDGIVISASGALEMDAMPKGSIALVSQSGGILGSLLSRASGRGIGLSRLIATGNEVDLELADFVDHLAGDDATSVIALYMEGLRNVDKFRAAALKAARAGKSVVVFKVGRSESGARAAASHTGALAGADRMYDALFRQFGVIRAQTFSDLLDIPVALAAGRRLKGKRVAVLTSTGGAGGLVVDSLGSAGFEAPAPDDATAARLRALQDNDQAVLDRNPIDVTLAGLQPKLLRGAISAILESPTYDAAVVIVGSSALAQPNLMADALHDCLAENEKPVVAYVSPYAPHVEQSLNLRGVPAYSAPESCPAALNAMLHASRWQAPAAARMSGPGVAIDDLPRGSLNEAEAKQLFARFGVPSVRERIARTPQEAQRAATGLGGHVVVKILSRTILHKSEVGGVAVNVPPAEVGACVIAMRAEVAARAGTAPEEFLVQEMVSGGTELILGFHRDPQLGPAVLLGMGGVTAELYKDTTMRLLPVSPGDAEAMVKELRSWPLLDGFRGRPKGDLDALVAAIVAFASMAAQLGDALVEAEVNPLFVLPRGQGVRAADGIAIVR
jgi:acyl-CoA synthetase (NDP forming)